MTSDVVRDLLRESRTVAVVGCSPKPERPSFGVARYLQRAGYRIVPVNPGHDTILGERSYRTLADAAREQAIDIVDVFRRTEFAGVVVDEAIAIHPKLIWLQLGVTDDAARARAEAAGIPIVMDRCLAIDHRQLVGD